MEQQIKRLETRELKELCKELSTIKASHATLTTLYLKPGTQLNVWHSKLKKEKTEALNIKSKETRNKVSDSLRLLTAEIKKINKIPKNGICIFAGNEKVYMFEPPLPILSDLYLGGNCFQLDALEIMCKEEQSGNKVGFVIVSGKEAVFALVQGGRLLNTQKLSVELPNKHRRGGQSAGRFFRECL